jgi:agmatine deiminase
MAPSPTVSLTEATSLPWSTGQTPRARPADLGYRMPAEWEPHDATWIAWPHNRSDWAGKFEPVPWVYAEVIRHLSQVERVEILVNDAAAEKQARAVLKSAEVSTADVNFHRIPTNRSWTRDFLPNFVRMDGIVLHGRDVAAQLGVEEVPDQFRLGMVKWRFNGWAKYKDWRQDEDAAGKMIAKTGMPAWFPAVQQAKRQVQVVLEGGAIDVNGRGTLLTTEECLLSESQQQRNPGITREELEGFVAAYLGIRHVIWLGRGIAGDDTHGHIDDIARFVSPDTVVACVEWNPADPNHEPLNDNLHRLRAATDQDGRPLRVIELPMPAPVSFRGQRLPASYANFYIANGLVLVPTFNDPNDRRALNILADLFPDRQVVGIYCGDLVLGLGTLHCMTQQQPRAEYCG